MHLPLFVSSSIIRTHSERAAPSLHDHLPIIIVDFKLHSHEHLNFSLAQRAARYCTSPVWCRLLRLDEDAVVIGLSN